MNGGDMTERLKTRRTGVCGALLMATTALTGIMAPTSVLAQTAASAQRKFNIPAQPLREALLIFGQQSGLQVTAQGPLVEGRTSSAVSGDLPPAEALRRLLTGTGLTFRFDGADAVRLEPVPQTAGAIQLGPVRVEGDGNRNSEAASLAQWRDEESPTGPGRGYVASRSMAGTKTNTPLIETPQSIAVITRDQMEDRGVKNLSDAFAYTAGVIGDNVVEGRYDKPVIRGFSARQYLDGLYLNYYASGYLMPRVETYGLERAEILRGPSSVLYGANAPGGMVNMVSKRPTADPLREINLQYGSYDRKQASFDLGGAVDENNIVTYRLTGLWRKSDTQTDYAKDDRIFIAPAVTFRPSADTSLTLLAHYQHDKQGTAINFLPSQGTVTPTVSGRRISTSFFTGEPSFNAFDREDYGIGYEFEHRFNDTFKVRQSARYMHADLSYTGVYAAGWNDAAQTQLRRGSLSAGGSLDTIGLDTNAEAKFATGPVRHTVIVGIDYQHGSFDDRQGYGTVGTGLGLIDAFDPVYGATVNPISTYTLVDQSQRQLGVYFQDQMKLTERLTFVAGGRQDWARSSTDSKRRTVSTGVTTTPTNVSIDQQKFTYRFGLVYETPSGLAPYISYSTSFQPQAGASAEGTPFVPTTGKQIEVGVKYQPTGVDGFVTASLYDLRQQNVLTSDPSHPGTSYQIQTGEVRSRGFEIDGTLNLSDSFKTLAAYTFADTEVTRSNGTDLGKTPINRPRHVGSLWGDYTQRTGWASGLGLGLGVRYVGKSYGDALNTFEVPEVWLADAALHYTLDQRWRFSITATNLLDKKYVGQCGSATTCYYGYRRSVIGTATYRF
ncbi:TonB-dependent siderophore receptor [Sphingomonas sp. YL-JM2C]